MKHRRYKTVIKVLYCNKCVGPLSVVCITNEELGLDNDVDQKLTDHSNRQHGGVSSPLDFYWSAPVTSHKKAQDM